MKIIHAIARLNVGGAALSVLELAHGQQRRGHDVLVVAGRIPAGEASLERMVDELEVPHLHLPELQRELDPRHDLAATRKMWALLRARRPDVLHTHTAKAGTTGRLAAAVAADARPDAVVHTYHGHVLTGYFAPRRERAYRLIERALAHATDKLVAVSEEVRDDLVRLRVAPVAKFEVIPYGFDLDRRGDAGAAQPAQRRAELGIDDGATVIGWAGRLTAIKRPLDLVRVAAAVDGSVLVLIGDGELRSEVETLARELGIENRVKLPGYVDEIGPWYAMFDVFCLTSANEGTPVVAIEALAAGVPVVATDAGGTRTVVDDGATGFLAPVGDVAALAERISSLVADESLRQQFGERGAMRMRERFSIGRMVDDVDGLYEEIRGR